MTLFWQLTISLVVLIIVIMAALMLSTCKICGTHKCLTKEDCDKVRKGEL